MGADTKKLRTKDSIQIIEYTYATYSQIKLKEKIEDYFNNWTKENNIQIEKGKEEYVLPQLESIPNEHYLVKDGEEQHIEIQMECKTKMIAPVEANTAVGILKVMFENEKLLELELAVPNKIERKEPIDYWEQLWEVYINK